MQFRFVEKLIDENENENDNVYKAKIQSIVNFDDWYTAYKVLKYMEKEETATIEINIKDIADTDGIIYEITSVTLVVPKVSGDILPHVEVVIRESCY